MTDASSTARVTFRARSALGPLGVLVLVIVLVPPLSDLAKRYVFVEALQYLAFGVVSPGLIVLGAPWRSGRAGAVATRWQSRRQAHGSLPYVVARMAPAFALFVIWRLAPLVDPLEHHAWVLALEVISLFSAGILLWLECVGSGPLGPVLSSFGRIGIAALAMWTIWALGYIVGLAGSDVYPVFLHEAHRVLGIPADQQIAAGIMWFVAAFAFIPVASVNLVQFLRNDTPTATTPSPLNHWAARPGGLDGVSSGRERG
jgi:cytochrome c oxidase assembly factor CtaG